MRITEGVTAEFVRVVARASNGSREQKRWVDSFVRDAADRETLERDIATAIASALRAAAVAAN